MRGVRVSYAQEIVDRLDAEIPGNDPDLLRLYALLVMSTGVNTTMENIHDAWALWRIATRPDHPDLVPFDRLTPEVREYDRPYMDAVIRVAEEIYR